MMPGVALLREAHHAFIHLAGDAETFAGCFFQPSSVEDGEFAAVVFDKVCLLQEAGRQIHALSAHTQHVTEKLLGEPELVLTLAMSRLQQPSAHPLLYGVVLDAGPVLCPALDENERIAQQQL